MRSVKVGLVGCGRVAADLHLPALARVDGLEAVAVTDVDAGVAQSVAERFGVARVERDAEALAAGDVDVVAVCTPPRFHVAAALHALRAGRAVLVEKPLALTVDEADTLAEAGADADALAFTGFNLRVHRQVALAREMLAAGDLGELRMVRTHWTSGPRPGGWRGDADDGGSVLWELGTHHLDLWRVLGGGEPVDVRASGDHARIALTARIPGGPLLASTLSVGTSDGHEVELVGSAGRLVLTLFRGDGPHWTSTGVAGGGVGVRLRDALGKARSLPRQARAARAGGDYVGSFAREWEAIRAAVVDGAPPHATLADGRAAVLLAREAERALADGAAV